MEPRFRPVALPRRRRMDSAMSAPLEARLALLVEGPDPLQAVLGGDGVVVGLDGEAEGRLEVGLAAPADRLLGLSHRYGPIVGDGGGDLQRLGARRSRGAQGVDEPDAL